VERSSQIAPEEERQDQGQNEPGNRPQEGETEPGAHRSPYLVQRDGNLKEDPLPGEFRRHGAKETDLHLPRASPADESHVPCKSLRQLRRLQGNPEADLLKGKIGGGSDDSTLPIQDRQRVSDSPGQGAGHAIRILPGEIVEEKGEELHLVSKLPPLDGEQVFLQASVRDQDLSYRQEQDDGEEGAEDQSPDGQLSPSGTLNR
jgi:hypothetical protein